MKSSIEANFLALTKHDLKLTNNLLYYLVKMTTLDLTHLHKASFYISLGSLDRNLRQIHHQ